MTEPTPPSPRTPDLVALRRRLARALRELRRERRTDPLTGLAGRRELLRRLAQEAARAERLGGRLALLMLDLDRFKALNDRHGHLEGDRLLVAAAGALAALAGPRAVAGRYGGDEFGVLLPGADDGQARAAADRLRRGLAEALGPDSGSSLGLALLRPGEPPEALLARADAALVRAKRLGGGRVVEA